jgi:invasion protein IalB
LATNRPDPFARPDKALTSAFGHAKPHQISHDKDLEPMPRYLSALPAALIMALALPAFAQDTTTTQEPAAEPAAEGEAKPEGNVEDALSMGENVDGTPTLGQPYTAKTIGAWEMRCIKTEDETDPCQMYQLLDDGQGSPVAEFSMFRLPEGGQAMAGATVIVPLETALAQQLTISVDGAKGKRYPYAFCNAVGCYSRIGLTQEDIDAFKRGNEAKLTIVPALAPDQPVIVTLSLEGFTASYNEVSVISP